MKISYMLKRESFYDINEKTLGAFYSGCNERKKLYVYPELNAIVTAWPSKKVKEYLYTEYRVSGSLLRRIAVRLYATVMLNSGGLLASKRFVIKTSADNDTLIYPCNKKYRIFDFGKNSVSVTPKYGFPTGDLENEIAFRSQNHADFIPKLASFCENGYSEAVIDGYPIARAGERQFELCERAYNIWQSYISGSVEKIPSIKYAQMLEDELAFLSEKLVERKKDIDTALLCSVMESVLSDLRAADCEIEIGLSHGDLQSGNIWVENGTDKIYIIDWESYGKRSLFYDRAALYDGIRRKEGISRYMKHRDLAHSTVLAEDIIFRVKELINLPENFGSDSFNEFLFELKGERNV